MIISKLFNLRRTEETKSPKEDSMRNWTLVYNQKFNSPREGVLFFELYRRNLKHKSALPEVIEAYECDFSFPNGIGVYSELIANTKSCKKKNSPNLKTSPYKGFWSATHTTFNRHTLISMRVYRDFATIQVFRDFAQIKLDYDENPPQLPQALTATINESETLFGFSSLGD